MDVWRHFKHSDDQDFYALLGKVHELLVSQSNCPPFSPILHQVRNDPYLRAQNILNWMMDHQVGIDGVDDVGNTFPMIVLKQLQQEKRLKFIPHKLLYKNFIKNFSIFLFDLQHQNQKGETFLHLAKEVGSDILLSTIEEELQKRDLILSSADLQ